MQTPIIAFYGGLLAILYIYLSLIVIKQRRSKKVGIGFGEDKHLHQVIRVHSNFAEYVPIAMILMLVSELNQGNYWFLHACGVTLLFGRLLHAYGLRHHVGKSWQRFSGVLMTFIVILALAVNCLATLY